MLQFVPEDGRSWGEVEADLASASPESQDRGIVQDVLWNGAVGGAVDAVNETTDFGHSVVNWMDDKLGTNYVPDANPLHIDGPDEAQTLAGQLTRGISQFAVGFAGAGKFLKLAGVAGKLAEFGKLGELGLQATKGALTDAVAFNPYQERLANLIEEFPALHNPVTDYLQAKDDDSEAEGRLKNALEGLGVGAVAEPFAMVVKYLKGYAKAAEAGGKAAADKVFQEGADEVSRLLHAPEPKTFSRPVTKNPVPDEVKLSKTLDPEKATDFVQKVAKGEIDLGKADVKPPEGMFNTDKLATTDDVKHTMNELTEMFMKHVGDEVEHHVDLKAQADDLADIFGTQADSLVETLQVDFANVRAARARLLAAKTVTVGLTQDVLSQAGKYLSTESAQEGAAMLKKVELIQHLAGMSKLIQREYARGTSMGNITVEGIRATDASMLENAISRAGGHDGLKDFARKISLIDNPKAMVKLSQGTLGGKLLALNNEYWINCILSGMRTQTVNFLSNSVQAAIMPAERIIGGALTGDTDAIREGARIYSGMRKHFSEALDMAWKAFKGDSSRLDPVHTTMDNPYVRQMAAGNWGYSDDSIAGNIINFAGTFFNIPSRLLMTSDEFFKQLSFRGKLHADLVAKAVSEGVGEGLPKAERSRMIAEYVEDNFEKHVFMSDTKVVTPDGRLGTALAGSANADSPLASTALQYSREATFSQDLQYGIGRSVQDLVNRHPSLRMVLPFVRTPTNILRSVWQHTPGLNLLQRQWMAEFSAGGSHRASAVGKMAVGTMVWSLAAMLASEGKLIGGGPTHPAEREVWLKAGNVPYSVKFSDGTTLSLNRLDPWGTFLGIAADIAEISGHTDDKTLGDLAAMGVTAMMRNLGSKTYLMGLVEIANTLSDPDRYGGSMIERRAASYVPFSSLAANFAQAEQAPMREVRGFLERIKSRIPGYAEDLPAKHNWLTGEVTTYPPGWGPDVMSPFPQGDLNKVSPAIKVMEELGVGWQGPPRKFGSLELTGAQYSELCRLTGTTRIGGRTLIQSLERVTSSRTFQRLGEGRAVSDYERYDARVRLITSTIRDYVERAKKELFRSTPDLKQAYTLDRRNALWAKRGQLSKIEQIVNQ